MGRWQADAAARLSSAALELYAARGYEETTVAEVAARAGLTERTFYRHFADKREVLFGGAALLEATIAEGVADAPRSASALEAVVIGLEASAPFFDGRRELVRLRQQVILANPELQEREVAKLARLATAVGDALRGRGVVEPGASLAAQAGAAVFHVAFQAWLADETASFGSQVRATATALQRAVAEADG